MTARDDEPDVRDLGKGACLIYRDEQQLGDLMADGKITAGDADQVRRFAEWLRHAGPPDWESKTDEQQQWCRAALADPAWREYLGLPALDPEPAP